MNLSQLNTGWLIACGFALVVLLINLGLFSMLRKKNQKRSVSMYTNMLDTIRSPWKNEEKSLTELDAAVKQIQNQSKEDTFTNRSKNE
jgi:choline-glycine betaine transporter